MKSAQISALSELVEAALPEIQGFLVDVAVRGERGSSVVEVFIDTDRGVTADECASVSRRLSADLDRLNLIPGRYRIEVSSPGLDRPLKLPRQFSRNIGRHLRVVSQAEGGAAEIDGVLKEVSAASLSLQTKDGNVRSIDFEEIREAHVLPQFK
ncbi:MAG TPA: ribosome maturation factor RimP [Bacteroidota bacterium]|nr:ribosome maturation factor RimP [Bacteroidota bacterium]